MIARKGNRYIEILQSEKDFQKEAIEYLKNHPKVGDVWRNDGRRTRGRKFGAVGGDRPKGLSDLIGYTVDGRIFAIELKSDTGKITDDQERFIFRVKGFNGRSGLARSLDELDGILDQK